MDISFTIPHLDYSIDSIMEFQNPDVFSEWWRRSLFMFYPQIDRNQFDRLVGAQRRNYLHDVMKSVYQAELPALKEKVTRYHDHWKLHKAQVEAAFTDAFQCDCSGIFNQITANVTFNPISPRYLDTDTFDIFYLNSERGALGISLHEVIHFVWFYVWNKHFNDDPEAYDQPHLKWVLSEMVVQPIMRKDPRLHKINPYFDDECVYEYFYDMKVDGSPILETLYSMYVSMDITSFMEKAYTYCQKHEAEIRRQMD